MHYYQFNIGDYASHTGHLDPMEDIAYRRMIDLYYLHEDPLPDDVSDIARLIRMRTHCDVIANVLREFFTENNGGWCLPRADKEIAAYKLKSEKAKKSAEARWHGEAKKDDANALQSESEGNAKHKPLNINHKPKKKENKFSSDDSKAANYILGLIIDLNPNNKRPNMDDWSDMVRLMRERDKRTHKEICELFQWANNDNFWKANILSPKTLRKQWDKLTIQKNTKPSESNTSSVMTEVINEILGADGSQMDSRSLLEVQSDISEEME